MHTISLNKKAKAIFNASSIVQHCIFWVVLAAILTALDWSGQISIMNKFVLELVNVAFFAVVVYFNIYYLFPFYVKQRKLNLHLLWLLLTAAVITPIKVLAMVSIAPAGYKSMFIDQQLFIFLAKFFVGTSASIYAIMKDWINSQQEKVDLANQTLQSELKFLKSQINPHFLFNTLNSLYALTLKKSDLAPEIVLKLSEMMRYMLYECNEKMVSLEKEVNYIINYLDLEKLRHGKKINIIFSQTGDIRDQKIAPLLFIPFIENCFKHGVSTHITDAFVKITIDVKKEIVAVVIENSKYAVMPGAPSKKSGGIGLANVKRRLDILYADSYKLDISDTPNTYKIDLKLNLNNNTI